MIAVRPVRLPFRFGRDVIIVASVEESFAMDVHLILSLGFEAVQNVMFES